ncbi:MAG TPA: alpha/beta fold hydrolase [Actinomycetota bacterium]
MPNVLMPSLTRALDAAGWASLRFNYRGVGRSQGSPASELSELDDVRGALAYAGKAIPVDETAVIGWSSGSTIALWACAGDADIDVFVGLSPPVSAGGPGIPALPKESMLRDWTTRTLLVRGTNDPACCAEDLAILAKTLSADVETVSDADHAFNGRLAEMSALVTWYLR